jgi:putative hydrolase of the HAD superfamily
VKYSASRTEQGFGRSFDVLQQAGCRLDYDKFLELWSSTSTEFDGEARRTLREFSMSELGRVFFERAKLGEASLQQRALFLETYLEEWNKGVRFIPGVVELLDRLAARFRLAVITNTHDAKLVPRHLEAMGAADSFEAVFTSVEFGFRKPHAAIFDHAVDTLGVSATECLYVGDDPVADYQGATAAGLRALLIDPHGDSGAPALARLASILDLESHLASGGGGSW